MEVNTDLPFDDDGSVIGLTEVDPSPVDTPPEYREKSYFPDQERPEGGETEEMRGIRRMNTLGLRLGERGPAWWLLRTQKYSSYTFTAFAALHITNVSIIPLATRSVVESNRYLLLTRPYYQSALTEPLLVALPLAAHITSGIALRFWRRRQALLRYGAETRREKRTIPWPVLSGTSALGYALIPLAGFHIWTTRILPLYAHGDSSLISLNYISHGFALHPKVSFAGFTALVSVGAWHVVWGAAKWLGFAPSQVKNTEENRALVRKRRWYTINGISAGLTLLWLGGSLGVVGLEGTMPGWVGKEYDELYKYLPIIGKR
ncbi:hypothetical protein COCMIDRAFT_6714 [Bipolaris oryzae ATCC 44560]|uniref:Mitochondrial adapter protein MCP1 transmembrane domain-containing protein n=1 Tax=Bipolaris oryzae ATCC 44560 TaxID=930090 RepID=W6Z1T9_COCMI|nr:uncharacterized protein COCMIDRAFT_6714 [Bipolaris oryzae ATCC 44560]EUC43935.1 hypothetical protein COCMIDRAFT_6714 [Bipolaris oryzae ATCC 44560]